MDIIKYSHGFMARGVTEEENYKLRMFHHQLTHYELQFRGRGKRPLKVPGKTYAFRTIDKRTIHYHINLYDEYIEYCKAHFIHIRQIIDKPLVKGKPLRSKMISTFVPRENQVGIIDFILEPNKRTRLIGVQTGFGKASSVNAKIKVPGGWKKMGDILVGDTVTAWDGTPTKVLGVYPQGVVETFRVTFSDGRSTVVTGDHLWKVYYINTVQHRRWRIVDTKEMIRLIGMPNPRVYIPLCESEVGGDIQLPLNPYVLGVLLGDGSMTINSLSITKADQELFDTVSLLLPEGDNFIPRSDGVKKCLCYGIRGSGPNVPGKNKTLSALKEMGLIGKRSHDKFIPEEYLYASTEQRWALLQGLMDTDGTVGQGGTTSYCTTSEVLAKQVQYLVRSLGGIAKIAFRTPNYTYKGVRKSGRLAFNLIIRMKTPSKLFRLTRKKERTNDDNQYAKDLKLRVVSIVANPEPEEAQCIAIEHPDHLYITDDFIVTHNTSMALKAAETFGKRVAVVCSATYLEKWKGDVRSNFVDAEDRVIGIVGVKKLLKVIDAVRAGKLDDIDFFIFSNETLRSYYKSYRAGELPPEPHYNPYNLYEELGVGYKIVDEAHESFYDVFIGTTLSNVEKEVSLSATIYREDEHIDKMVDIAFAKPDQNHGDGFDCYIDVFNVAYHFMKPERLRFSYDGEKYNQQAFEEQTIMNKRTPHLIEEYLDMVVSYVKEMYIDKHSEGQTCLVFCGKVEMCEIVRDALAKAFPNKVVTKLTGEDPETNFHESDICVSTVGSAGTAKDKYGLRTIVSTVSMSSSIGNRQLTGRLRQLRNWPGQTPECWNLYCPAIKSHRNALEARSRQLGDKVKSIQYVDSGIVLKN